MLLYPHELKVLTAITAAKIPNINLFIFMVFVFLVKLNYDSIYELDIKLHAFVTIWEFLCQVDKRSVDFNKVKFGFEAQVIRFF
ncbi:hypothetical protein GCM10022289_42190 [Pedobacter jeongneungensis]|uniref:Uncharacterized protein n=1 Tax=Pedobacter jeongneungensis TaxID=947309 RepID=A0ABP8BPC0_9SPHI